MATGTAKIFCLKSLGCLSIWVMYMWYFESFSRKGASLGSGRVNGGGGSLEAVAESLEEEVLLKVRAFGFPLGGILRSRCECREKIRLKVFLIIKFWKVNLRKGQPSRQKCSRARVSDINLQPKYIFVAIHSKYNEGSHIMESKLLGSIVSIEVLIIYRNPQVKPYAPFVRIDLGLLDNPHMSPGDFYNPLEPH